MRPDRPPIELTAGELTPKGPAAAEHAGRPYLLWGALPGERVLARPYKKGREWYAAALEVLDRSPHRVETAEPHHLCCSPWQILSDELASLTKRRIASAAYRAAGHPVSADALELLSDPARRYGYRNKMEYGFYADESGLFFSFFERHWKRKCPIDVCRLAEASLNTAALGVLGHLRAAGRQGRPYKTLLLRHDGSGNTIASLYVTDGEWSLGHPEGVTGLAGFQVHHSDRRTPASVSHAELYRWGTDTLETPVLGRRLSYGVGSFFQINVPLFERALERMAPYVETGRPLVDLYGGVGAIGVSLGQRAASVTVVDSAAEAIEHAQRNLERHLPGRSRAELGSAEKLLDHVTGEATLIVDPPRTGLHPEVVSRILSALPPRVIYLSCNVLTQARDYAALSSAYAVRELVLLDFFPNTPHIESLLILERR
ncbi:MAG: 23S rRNA (uracil-C(5))-methyltransferase RlmCD [Candidatus Omnitrophica bacterium]|nr:23S rRNA (uracil-C(5))-methyltransferase RlmCD [Candidatus Omnitrophota bacterium]